VGYCRVHGHYSEYEDGCPDCRDWQDRVEADQDEVKEILSDIAWRTSNPGDYECPHCRYVSLKRDASRCPMCHANPGAEFWQLLREREHDAWQRKKAADAEAAKIAEASRLAEAEDARRRAKKDAAVNRVFLSVIGVLCTLMVLAFAMGQLVEHLSQKTAPGVDPSASTVPSTTTTSGAGNSCCTEGDLDRPGVTTNASLHYGGPAFRGTIEPGDSVILSVDVPADTASCRGASENNGRCHLFLYSGGRPGDHIPLDQFRRNFTLPIDQVDVEFYVRLASTGTVVGKSLTMGAGAGAPGHMAVFVSKEVTPGVYEIIVHGAMRGRFSILWWGPLGD
jgi:hypothetical protein